MTSCFVTTNTTRRSKPTLPYSCYVQKLRGGNSAHGGTKGEIVIIRESGAKVVFKHIGRGARYGEKLFTLPRQRFDRQFRNR